MLMIRLQRVGRTNDPSFRVVLTDSKNSTKSGKIHEVLGSYNARFGKPHLEGEKILAWVKKGVQLTDTMHNLLIKEGFIKGKKINVVKRKAALAVAAAAEAGTAAPLTETPPVQTSADQVETVAEVPQEAVSEEAKA